MPQVVKEIEDRGQSGATKHLRVLFLCLTRPLGGSVASPFSPVSTCPSFPVQVTLSFNLLSFSAPLLYSPSPSLPLVSHTNPAHHTPVSLQALCSWTRAVRSSSLRVSPSPSLWSSLTAASPTTPQTWRRCTTDSLQRRATSSSMWWTVDKWVEPLRCKKLHVLSLRPYKRICVCVRT